MFTTGLQFNYNKTFYILLQTSVIAVRINIFRLDKGEQNIPVRDLFHEGNSSAYKMVPLILLATSQSILSLPPHSHNVKALQTLINKMKK